MMRILAFFLALTSLFVTMPPVFAQDDSDLALPQSEFKALRPMGLANVSAVIDPYTIQLEDGRTLRLINIQYPDYGVRELGEFSIAALQILRDMLEGQTVQIFQTADKDFGRVNRMGHHLVHIQRQSDNVWVQGTLIALGLAYTYPMQRNPEMVGEMYAVEDQARAQKIGIWDEDTGFGIISPENAGNLMHSYQIVEGTIQSVAINKNRIYMNFGPDWRTDFTVSIAPGDKRAFLRQGLDPMQWNNKKIRVRGWIESYNGPYIEINQPEAIMIFDDVPAAAEENPRSTLQDPS